MVKLRDLVIAILICQFAGVIGSVFTFQSIPTWYASLQRPSFSPPDWVFGPVWVSLYTLMGVSLYLVSRNKGVRNALMIFSVQLALNALWSIVFFGFHSIAGGLLIIIALWLAILGTILMFYRISEMAAYLLVPYLLWVSLATVLNYYIWILN